MNFRIKNFILPFAFSFLLFSCNEEPKPKADLTASKNVDTFGERKKTGIGTTDFTIDLPVTHKMEEQKGPDFTVYYITSIDTTINKGGAGIYFGPAPDEHGPPTVISKTDSIGTTFGKNSKRTEFITPGYTWIETVIDEDKGNKIQLWYFAFNDKELHNLGSMMQTIARKN